MTNLTLADLLVAVVEPSPTQSRIISDELYASGVGNVTHCHSGAEALEVLLRESPDLVVSAMYLPDMTGNDLIHAIRSSERFGDTPFLLVSSETRFRYLEPVRQAGSIGILPKPFSADALRAALNATIDLIEPQADDSFEGEDLHVLLVDDSEFSRKHIGRVLAALGIKHIDQATDGVEALGLLAAHYYDFVVTDYNMPRMDGRELVEHIRHDAANASLPILMVTSEQNSQRLAVVQQSGVSAICDKPFEPATVCNLVRRILS
jgi:two-component system chemotaxis response regulator CheY